MRTHEQEWSNCLLSVCFSNIDECVTDADNINCGTNAACNNTLGSFTCTCNRGHTRDGDSCRGKVLRHSAKACVCIPVADPEMFWRG
jgi:hypothetical protein